MNRMAVRLSVARRSWSALAPVGCEESGGRTTHESLRGAPAKISMTLIEVLRVETGVVILSGVASCTNGVVTLVTARPAPVPVNSTFTIVVEADVAGPSLGTEREGARESPRPQLRFSLPEPPKSFESGAIQPPPEFDKGVLVDEDSSLGFSTTSRTFGAIDGSRTMSLSVVRTLPSSLKMSLKNLSSIRRSRRVQVVVNLSSSSAARKATRKLVTSAIIPSTVECDRYPTSAPRIF